MRDLLKMEHHLDVGQLAYLIEMDLKFEFPACVYSWSLLRV